MKNLVTRIILYVVQSKGKSLAAIVLMIKQ